MLILSSYEPVIWDVSAVAANDLRGIVAYGYYRPMVVGASDDLPVRIVALRNEAYESNGTDPVMRPNAADDSGRDDVVGHCGEPTWVSGPSREMAKMANNVETGIGLPVTQVVGTHSASKLSLKHPPLPSVADLERAAAECDTMAEECFPHGQSFGAKGPVRPGTPGEAKQAPPMRTKWRDDPWSSDGG